MKLIKDKFFIFLIVFGLVSLMFAFAEGRYYVAGSFHPIGLVYILLFLSSLIILTIAVFVIFLAQLIAKYITRKISKIKNWPVYFALSILIFFSHFFIISAMHTYYENENSRRSQLIINALDRYKQDKGQWPNSLDILVPSYLEKVPITTWGRMFVYQYPIRNVEDLSDYSLEYPLGSGWWGMAYNKDTNEWIMFD
jgi:hypothetical protein